MRFKSIFEANLAGSTVNYSQSTGAFYKYVQMAKEKGMDYEADRDAKLFDVNTSEVVGSIDSGTKFKILDKEEKDLEILGRSYMTRILLNKKEYRIRLSDILKPSGKKVDYIQVDLSDKEDPTVWKPFKGGHGHEGDIANVFINGSGGNWEFEHDGKEYHIERIGAPEFKGVGNPKTDLIVILKEKMRGYGNPAELKYSLKAHNATFIENWMQPTRFDQIFSTKKAIKLIVDMYDKLNAGEIGQRSPTMHWFIKDKKNNTGIFLDRKETEEAFSGKEKFGKNSEATANCFLKGDPTTTITALLDKTYPIASHGIKAGLQIRGYGKNTNSACYVKQGEGWAIRDNWIRHFKLSKKYRMASK